MSPGQQNLHLIYIHGFQGDHTTFQSFPKDLHVALSGRLSKSHPEIVVATSLYPTYKSKRPLSEATSNFLAWLSTQADGMVILMGHSMGGLLAAEAAVTAPSTGRQKVIGVVAFDTPFLGMHPHVVISGIASLFPQDDDSVPTKSESELNHADGVKVVSVNEVRRSDTFDSSTNASSLTADSSLTVPTLRRSESDQYDEFKSQSSRGSPHFIYFHVWNS